LIIIEPTIKDNCDKPEARKLIDMWEKITQLTDQALPSDQIAGGRGRGGRKKSMDLALLRFSLRAFHATFSWLDTP
jgi:hypothetical protein